MLIIHDGNSNKAFFTLCDFSVFYKVCVCVCVWACVCVGVGVCMCVCVFKAVKKLLVWLIVYMSRNKNQANCLTKLTNWHLRILVDLSFDYFFYVDFNPEAFSKFFLNHQLHYLVTLHSSFFLINYTISKDLVNFIHFCSIKSLWYINHKYKNMQFKWNLYKTLNPPPKKKKILIWN